MGKSEQRQHGVNLSEIMIYEIKKSSITLLQGYIGTETDD